MTKPTNDEIVAALRCDDPVLREAMAQRLEQKRPAYRPPHWTAPYVRAEILYVFHSFMLHLEHLPPLSVATRERGRRSKEKCIRLTLDWFAARGTVVSRHQVHNIINRPAPRITAEQLATLKKVPK